MKWKREGETMTRQTTTETSELEETIKHIKDSNLIKAWPTVAMTGEEQKHQQTEVNNNWSAQVT